MAFDVDDFLAIPRLSGLLVAPDGRLVVHAAAPDATGRRFVTAVWQVDPGGRHAPRRLTASRAGLAAVGFTPAGDLLFRDDRTDPDGHASGGAALWALPAGGGDAYRLAGTPAGVGAAVVARDAGTVVFCSEAFPGTRTLAEDAAAEAARRDAGTSAVYVEGYPFRQWDRLLGPRAPRLYVTGRGGSGEPHDLTGDVGWALRSACLDVTPDGGTVVTTWETGAGRGYRHRDLVTFDVATGSRRTLLHDPDAAFQEVACSPCGRYVAAVRETRIGTASPLRVDLWLVPLDGSPARPLAGDLDGFPGGPVWTPDGRAVLFVADQGGRAPLWRVDVAGGAPLRLSRAGAFSGVRVPPDGTAVYALRSTVATPPEVVVLDPHLADQEPRVCHRPGFATALPGRLDEVHATAADGTALRAWLLLPEPARRAPLLVRIHGGPMQSWNQWSWNAAPHLYVARGYAVLLPDPAMSTGYGQPMLERGWERWGGEPCADVLALTDAALARSDLDADRTAVAGASYGGYLTNWIVGHTDRFRAAVSHAGIWDLRSFRSTTDHAEEWDRWWGEPRRRPGFYRYWSPSSYAERITTPVLFTCGGEDFRTPVGEPVAAYTDLCRLGRIAALLYLPGEGHHVTRPGNVRRWHETALDWLDRHVRGPAGGSEPGQ